MVVRAFDGSKRDVVGTMDVLIMIGPITFNIEFQVMDIDPSYTCLLGRPWIHIAGVVPSFLHQKLKFRVENKVISVSGKQDILVMYGLDTPYVEATQEDVDYSFRSFKIIEVTFVA